MAWLIKIGVDTLETMFAVGAAGTVLVLVLSAIEDIHTIRDRSAHD